MDGGRDRGVWGCRGAVRTWGVQGAQGTVGMCWGWMLAGRRGHGRDVGVLREQSGDGQRVPGHRGIPGYAVGGGSIVRGPTSHRRCSGRDWVQGVRGGSGGVLGVPSLTESMQAGMGFGRMQGGSGWVQEVLPLAEGVQAGQHLGVAVAVEADAADQELLVNLPHHRAGGLMAGHGGSSAWEAHHSEGQAPHNTPWGSMAAHSHPQPQPTAPHNPHPPHRLVVGHGRPSA